MPHSLRDLACLLPLFNLHGTSFLPEMWEVSPPQIWGRLWWFVPWMVGAGPGCQPSTSQQVPGPAVAHTFSRSLPRDPLTCGRVSESSLTLRSSSRKTVVSLSRDKGVCLLPQNLFLFKPSSPLSQKKCLCFLFVCFVLTCFRVGDVSVLSLLQTGNRWFCFCARKVLFLEKLSFNRRKTFLQ